MAENKIPEEEHDNVMSLYWQMLREIEVHTRPEEDPLNALLVEGGYKVLNQISFQGVTDRKPVWK